MAKSGEPVFTLLFIKGLLCFNSIGKELAAPEFAELNDIGTASACIALDRWTKKGLLRKTKTRRLGEKRVKTHYGLTEEGWRQRNEIKQLVEVELLGLCQNILDDIGVGL